jgi:limonene-1,2-epoxide hydrolase
MARHSDERLDVVQRWTDAWNRLDWNGVADSFAEHATNHSMMDEPVAGREKIRDRTRLLMERVRHIDISLVRLSLLADGVVAAERIDSCQRSDGSWGRVPVAGFYEVTDGRIIAKRDYYDRSQLLDAMGLAGGGLPAATTA